jgi:hypothetical protein
MAAPRYSGLLDNANGIGDHATAMLHQLGDVFRLSGLCR